MKAKAKLSKTMTVVEFENGYWYATEIKDFAEEIGIPHSNKLRKDELERSIKLFLETGTIALPTKRSLTKSGTKDLETGLHLQLPVINYTSNRETKEFIMREAQKIAPGLKRKSGARYRLNRWREEQLTKGNKITYGDLVKQYVKLNQIEEPFEQIPIACYINFLSDFLKSEKDATRVDAIAAWKQLKRMNAPKTYRAWKKAIKEAMRKVYVLCIAILAVVVVDIVLFHARPARAQAVPGVRIDRVHFATGLPTGFASNTLGHIVGFQCQALGGGDAECFVASTSN